MLRAMRSMLSRFSLLVLKGTVVGKSAFMNAYPGRNNENNAQDVSYVRYWVGCFGDCEH